MLFEIIFGLFALVQIESEQELPEEDMIELEKSINAQLVACGL